MAIGNTLISSLKIVLMSTGVVFIAILLSLSLPQLLGSATFDLASLWFGIRACLRPPYLYFIINGIIITIVATSRLHHHHHAPAGESAPHAPQPKGGAHDHQHDVIAVRADQFSSYDAVKSLTEVINNAGSYYGVVSVKEVVDVEVAGSQERESRVVEKVKEKELYEIPEAEISVGDVRARARESRSTVVERSTWTAMTPPPALARQKPVEISPEFGSERPPASSRFGHHRRPAKASPAEGGKALRRVAKPKKKQQDTLESTWRTITEGRHMPLTRHLKKSDTWENQDRQIDLLDDSFPDPPVKKSQTFTDRTNHTPPQVPKLKKDPSLGQDDLNRRVEAFIHKFNADMKLQREQSIQQFMEKINRAAY